MPDPVRIAVIDSGVHVAHPHIDPSWLLPGFAVAKDGLLDSSDGAALDSLGHGTAVIAAIQDQSPDALCLPVRVFHDSLRTSARALLAAVDRAVEYGVDIINLSLGTVNPAHRPLFEVAAERALAVGTLIIAAQENDGHPCYPGYLPQVLGVRPDWELPRDRFAAQQAGREMVFCASAYPRPVPGVPPQHNLNGVSFAVANMTGLAAKVCKRLPAEVHGRARPETLRTLLEIAAAEQSALQWPVKLDGMAGGDRRAMEASGN